MNSTATYIPFRVANYRVIIPLSLTCIIIAIIIASIILSLVICIKRLHTVTHLLICNRSIASIFYCIVQCNNYIFLAFVPWETSDISCRWRGFFGYMTVAGIVYSYLTHAISRFFISILYMKYHWAGLLKTHLILIIIQWILVICLPLPALITNNIYYRPSSLCWVPGEYPLHLAYTIIAYYLLPTIILFMIYIYIYLRVKHRQNRVFITGQGYRTNHDLELLYNIMILFAIYTFGALPSILYIITRIEILYVIGIISVSLAVAIEQCVTLVLDRDFRNIIKNYIYRKLINST